MEQLNIAFAVIGVVVVAIGLLSNPVKKSLLQEPMIAMFVGVAVGPYGLGWLDVAAWGDTNTVIEHAARITLAIGLMGVALRLKRRSVAVLLKPVAVLLTAGMVGMWLASAAIAGWVLGLPLWAALLLGAILTPTDPVVASSIVTGRFAGEKLPRRLRDGISFEAGANDGLAYLFVMLPLLMIGHSPAQALQRLLTETLIVGVLVAALIGAGIGYVAARLLTLARKRRIVENASLLGYSVAFTLLTLGVAALLKADALIAVFLAGLVFNLTVDRKDEHEERHVQEAVAKLFTLPMFVIFGIALPIAEWLRIGWPLLAFALLILLLRRPPVIALLAPALRTAFNRHDVAYMAWFGPVGIAAMYYASFARRHFDDPLIWHAASAAIFASILLHGVSAAPLTRLYASRPGATPPAARELEAADQDRTEDSS